MARARRTSQDVAFVRDRRGRTWTVTVMPMGEDDDLAPWLDLSSTERLELMGECVKDGLLLEEKLTFPDFEEFIASLNAHRVRYLIVGGYAVGFHARPRATKDIDVLVDRSAANAKRTRAALISFLGNDPQNITVEKLMHPRTLIVLGVAPVRIDVLTAIDGVASFSMAWKRKAEGVYGAAPAYFLSLEDLVAAKLASGRPQDLADVDVLQRAARRLRQRRAKK